MNTQKIAISIPEELLVNIDNFSKQQGISRSKYISRVLYEKIKEEKNNRIKKAYNAVFSDESICREQLETADWFDNAENSEGQEW